MLHAPTLQPRIKKHPNRNEYVLAADVWVRNFTKSKVNALDINKHLSTNSDYTLYLENELENYQLDKPDISNDSRQHDKIVIISDGYGFDHHKLLAELPYKDVAIIAVNGALAKWQLIKNCEKKRAINYYVVNNPYQECMAYLPTQHRFYPHCIASIRTRKDFIQQYRGEVFFYTPVMNENYAGYGSPAVSYHIDDYRNPVCAAIGLAYKFGVKKLALMFCNNGYEHERPGTIKQGNVWQYPQQTLSQQLIEGNLYWLKNAGIQIASTANHAYCEYIHSEEVINFFKDDNENDNG